MEFPVLPGDEHRLEIRFVGSGSEYFRIWIVNLLLTLVTLGLYYPFAKVRRQRYFHGATEVGGHPLSYHADPWKVLRGYALVTAGAVVYAVASWLSPMAALLVLVLFAAAWPALWHSSLRFRLANTGWRGLRLQFLGTRRDAYGAMAPVMVLAVCFVGLGLLARDDETGGAAHRIVGGPAGVLAALLPLVAALAVPALLWRLRRYQHAHYGLAGEQTRFRVPVSAFYGVTFSAGFVAMAGGVVAAAASWALVSLFGRPAGGGDDPGATVAMTVLPLVVTWVVYMGIVGPYMTSRLQNLVWNGTRSAHLRFDSELRFGTLLGLGLRNAVFVVCTLGLYLPFAAIATARLRLQAVTVRSTVLPDTLVATAGPQEASALGDAAGDVAGIDLGL